MFIFSYPFIYFILNFAECNKTHAICLGLSLATVLGLFFIPQHKNIRKNILNYLMGATINTTYDIKYFITINK